MKKLITLLLAVLIGVGCSFAQKKVIVQGNFPALFVIHKSIEGETIANLANAYKTNAEALANNNGVTAQSSLAQDKLLRVTLDNNNFTQDGQGTENEMLLPLFYKAQSGDNLFKISQLFGRLRLDFLREWNDLNTDLIQPSQRIIIGFLRIDKKFYGTVFNGMVEDAVELAGTVASGVKGNDKNKTETNPTPVTLGADDEGYFVTQYPTNGNPTLATVKNGDAASFKSTSGWNDRKYYALMNDVVPGTIVRITSSNGRSICAKVLGPLPVMKDNKTLLLRISNAATTVLGIADQKFTLRVTYFE